MAFQKFLKSATPIASDDRDAVLLRIAELEELKERKAYEKSGNYRFVAYHLQDKSRSDFYRRKAMPHMQKALSEDIEPQAKIQMLTLLGYYNWRFGAQEDANGLFDRAITYSWKNEDGESLIGDVYYTEQINNFRLNISSPEGTVVEGINGWDNCEQIKPWTSAKNGKQ